MTSPSEPDEQTTLTQISFVSKPQGQQDLETDGLDYIGDGQSVGQNYAQKGTSGAVTIDLAGSDDEGIDDTNQHLPPARRVRTVRFDDEENSTRGTSSSGKSNAREGKKKDPQKSKEGKGKGKGKSSPGANHSNKSKVKDNTLTQMKFVRPIIIIKSDGADDDDVKLDYIYDKPKPADSKNMPESPSDDIVEGDLSQDLASPQREFIGSKRRRINGTPMIDMPVEPSIEHASGHGRPTNPEAARDQPDNPITPRKQRKREIPSSQSPESPGVALISSSQFRGSTRPSLEDVDKTLPQNDRQASPLQTQKWGGLYSDNTYTLGESTVSGSNSSMPPNSPVLGETWPDQNATPKAHSPQHSSLNLNTRCLSQEDKVNIPHSKGRDFEKNVVYDTDDESEDELLDVGAPLPGQDAIEREQENIREPLNDSSQTRNHRSSISPEANFEETQPDSEPFPSSNSSICYRRQQLSTQFPTEPIPMMNTQTMNELFPQESSPQPEGEEEASSQRQSPHSSQTKPTPLPRASSENRVQSVGETLSSNNASSGNKSESSLDQRHHANDSVVQVESSQPVDRLNKLARHSERSDSQGIFSWSQLLPPNIMESIPMPAFWTDSQDIRNEQYS